MQQILSLTLILLAAVAFAQTDSRTFTNSDLDVMLKSKSAGLITVVSPQMPLSFQNLVSLRQVAKEKNLKLTVLVDPSTSEEVPNDFSPELKEVKINESETLIYQGSLLHYPSVYYYSDGRLAPEVIYGAKSVDSYRFLISEIAKTDLEKKDSPEAITVQFDPDKVAFSDLWRESQSFTLHRTPKYYFKPLANGTRLAYQAGRSNFLLDVKNGDEIKLPGSIDPVPSPDEQVLTVPTFFATFGVGSLSFYLLNDLVSGHSAKEALIFKDKHIPGTYQSVGQRREGNHIVYRVVTESLFLRRGFYFQDYDGVEQNGRVTALKPRTKNARRLCPDIPFALPFLSKTGKLFGGVDPISRTTKIFQINDRGDCSLKASLGFPTGKLDFSFDDKLIAFHVSPIDSKAVTRVMTRPRKGLRLDVYVYDLEKRSLSRLTDCKNGNCYYPGFKKDNSIVYLQQDNVNHSYSFVTLKRTP